MSKNNTLDQAGKAVHTCDIIHHDGPILLPNGMDLSDAIKLIKSRDEFLNTEVKVHEKFEYFPFDGAIALSSVLSSLYGWAQMVPTPGFFGPNPPVMIRVQVKHDKWQECPWGRFTLPDVAGWIETQFTKSDKGQWVFGIVGKILRRDEGRFKEVCRLVREHLSEKSIYRGCAIKIAFRDEHGETLSQPQLEIMNHESISHDDLIYSKDVTEAVDINLFTPIREFNVIKEMGIRTKRAVLLGGTFGTGKTMAAKMAAKIAAERGMIFVYVSHADELSDAILFARQYDKNGAVVFVEDIDRSLSGNRSVKMDDILNVVDGIDTKDSNIMMVLTTNDLEAINPAMLRPGRLDAIIEVTPPDPEAVNRLIRLYSKGTIEPEEDLTEANELLAGSLPATIAEVLSRAKLAQLRLVPGTRVTKLSGEAICGAARSMQAQISLLTRRIEEENAKEQPPVGVDLVKMHQDIVTANREIRTIKERIC